MRNKIFDIARTVDSGCSPYYRVLPDLINERSYSRGIEIGVFAGGHAYSLLTKTDLDILVGIDPYCLYEQNPTGMDTQQDYDDMHDFILQRLDPDRYFHIRKTSDNAFADIVALNELFDFVFIDGLHTYEQLVRDLGNYSTVISKGGVIACHDYKHQDFPTLTNAIDEFAQKHNADIIECPFHTIYMNKTW